MDDETMFSEVATVPLHVALAEARRMSGLALRDAAAAACVPDEGMQAIEDGRDHPSQATIIRLARLYRLDPDRLGTDAWVVRSEPKLDLDTSVLWLEWLPIRFGETNETNADILERVAAGVRVLRDVDDLTPIRMRNDELELVAKLVDLRDDGLVEDLVRSFRLPWREAEDLIGHHRLLAKTSKLESLVQRLCEIQGSCV